MTDLNPKAPMPKAIIRYTCEGCPCLQTKNWSFEGENDERDSGTDATCAATGRAISNYWHAHHDAPSWCPAFAALPDHIPDAGKMVPPSPAVVPDGWKLVPVDDETREFANSALPVEMIHAGMDALEKVDEDNANYVAGETTDWDNGMVAVAVYRAMLSASPSPPALDGAERDAVIEECAKAGGDTLLPSHPILAQQVRNAISAIKETP